MLYSGFIKGRMKAPKYAEAEGKGITVNDSLKRPFRNMKLFGESSQATHTECKNLLPCSRMQHPGSLAGLKIKVENGYIKINGTTTGSTLMVDFPRIDLPPGTYTQSIVDETGYGNVFSVINRADGTIRQYANNNITITISEGEYISYTRIRLQNVPIGTTFEDAKLYVMIEAGNTATEWEPCATITPNNPINIDSIENPSITINDKSIVLDGITLRGLKTVAYNTKPAVWSARDEIVVDGLHKKVKLIQNVGSFDLGSKQGSSITDEDRYYIYFDDTCSYAGDLTGNTAPILCRELPVASWGSVLYRRVDFGICLSKVNQFNITFKGISDLTNTEIQARLSGYIVYYPTSNPKEIDITDTASGQALLSLCSYRGTTRITLNSALGDGDVWMKYHKQ